MPSKRLFWLTLSRLILPKTVLQLAWRPVNKDENAAKYELAVAGEDSSLRIYGFGEEYFIEQKQS
jgi:elongator complex protein 2